MADAAPETAAGLPRPRGVTTGKLQKSSLYGSGLNGIRLGRSLALPIARTNQAGRVLGPAAEAAPTNSCVASVLPKVAVWAVFGPRRRCARGKIRDGRALVCHGRAWVEHHRTRRSDGIGRHWPVAAWVRGGRDPVFHGRLQLEASRLGVVVEHLHRVE